jgi:hypothetical protein
MEVTMELLFILLMIGVLGYGICRGASPAAGNDIAPLVGTGNAGEADFDGWAPEDPDYINDPMYSYLPFNLLYSEDDLSNSSISDDDDDDDDGMLDSSTDDLLYDPAYSCLDCNIHHTDDDFGSSDLDSGFDSSDSFNQDDW